MAKKYPRKKEVPLSNVLLPDEKRKYLDYLKSKATTPQGRKRYLLIDLMLNSGLRSSEICSLKLCHTPGVIGANVLEVYNTKYEGDRSVPISRRLADVLEQYIKRDRSGSMPRHIKRYDPNGWLFFNQRKRKYKPAALYQMARRAGLRAKIPKRIRPHKFRHSYATNALDSGMDIRILQRRLGHKHLTTTMVYVHTINNLDFALAEACDQV